MLLNCFSHAILAGLYIPMAYPTGSAALEMRCCPKVMPEKTGKVPEYVVYLGKREGAASGEKEGKGRGRTHRYSLVSSQKILL